ncbi:hypothetical protein GDO81_016986 [Engystomops pustulosus]|uniref:Transmembrane protein 186 n=2 Tax=Engystomops pustulosus TaxID=76066 RepID=A0AAV7AES1_ENGPU|nr:hypothetical protein GDO81_016986 [Engystomops pustulosus]
MSCPLRIIGRNLSDLRQPGPCSCSCDVSMAQLIVKSLWIRPTGQRFSVQLWKCALPCGTSCTGFGRANRPLHGAVSPLRSSDRKQQIDSSGFSTSSPPQTDDSTKFTLIYKFPGIQFCRAVSRLKLVQTTLTVLILPPVYYYYFQGHITHFSVMYSTGTALCAGLMLYGLSYYLRRLIGMMYVDEDLTTLKVSHLTFWGNRRNLFVPIEDIKPLSETGDSKVETLRQFARYSGPDILYFTTRYGQVLDREKFTMVFGKLE